jgi:hypothetical protein
MAKRKRFFQNTIALVYDFDGTLSPQPMQEYTVLPKIGMKPKTFWQQVKKEAKDQKAIEIVTYMRMMYEGIEAKKMHIERKDLKQLATGIKYFPGVESWFSNINKYVRSQSVIPLRFGTTSLHPDSSKSSKEHQFISISKLRMGPNIFLITMAERRLSTG